MEVRGGGERFCPLLVCTGEEIGSDYSGFQRHRDALPRLSQCQSLGIQLTSY
jgi:hypothetical protein